MAKDRARVRYATIFVFPSAGGPKAAARPARPRVNAAPETLTVRPGDVVDWTIVDATGGDRTGKVTIKWKEASPLKAEPAEFDRAARAVVRAKAKPGRYRYSILVDGVELFDPEIEIMA
jgi:plastocyanin